MHNKNYPLRRWQTWLAALHALALPVLCFAAPRIDFGHYAPGAPAVSFEIDGRRVAERVEYRDYHRKLPISSGQHHVVARNDAGEIVAERDIELNELDGLVVFLSGDGKPGLPYELLISWDHNHPLSDGVMSVQRTNLAVVRTATGASASIEVGNACGRLDVIGSFTPRFSFVNYAHGTEGLAGNRFSGGYSLSTGPTYCARLLASRAGAEPTVYFQRSLAGLRVREIISGDGGDHPWVIDFIEQEVEPTMNSIAPSAAIEGLWFDPNNPGTGLLITYAPTDANPNRVKAVIYGFGPGGQATWRILDAGQIFQVVGGNPGGTAGVVSVSSTRATIKFFACDHASLESFGDRMGELTALPAEPFPRDAVILRKLLPNNCGQTAISQGSDAQ